MNPTDPRVTAALLHGENLLWSGKPDLAKNFSTGDVVLVPFSILWLAFVIFWLSAAVAKAPPFFVVWGSMFVCIGIYFTVGRFFVKRWRKGMTVYAITSTRAIAFVGARSRSDMPITRTPMSESLTRDGLHASVTFGTIIRRYGAIPYANTGLDIFSRWSTSAVQFFDVADPQPMLAAIRTARSPRSRDGGAANA